MSVVIKPFYLDLTENEIQDLQRVFGEILRSGHLILGKYTEQFESAFAEYVGCRHAVAMNTATSVLEVLCVIKGANGKKVAVPSNTNFATVEAIIRAGGKPVFMDMTKSHFSPNVDILRDVYDKYQVEGVMWVHIGGIVAPDFNDVVDFCSKHGLFLLEDAAHAHGSRMGGVSAGNFADGGAFSFFPTKVMTTMEGGMLTTNNKNDSEVAKSLRNQGKRHAAYGGLHYDHGNSWRISEIAAYMGLVQLGKLDAMVAARSRAAAQVAALLREIGISYCDTSHMEQASQYKFIIHIPENYSVDKIKQSLQEMGVVCGGGVYEVPCHQQPVFADMEFNKEELKVTEIWCSRHLCPPITSGTTDQDTKRICSALRQVLV